MWPAVLELSEGYGDLSRRHTGTYMYLSLLEKWMCSVFQVMNEIYIS